MLGIVASYHFMQLQGKLIKLTEENGKKPIFGPILVHLAQNSGHQFFFVFKNLAPSVTRYHGQLSSCTISETANDPILKNLSDGRTDEQADRPTDGRE